MGIFVVSHYRNLHATFRLGLLKYAMEPKPLKAGAPAADQIQALGQPLISSPADHQTVAKWWQQARTAIRKHQPELDRAQTRQMLAFLRITSNSPWPATPAIVSDHRLRDIINTCIQTTAQPAAPVITPRSQGIFSADCLIIEGLRHSPKQGLKAFMSRDTGSAIYIQEYPLHNGVLNLKLTDQLGQPCQDISGLKDCDRFFIAVRQEQRGRDKVKVLYGWGNREDWGIISRARISYVIAQQSSQNGTWQPLEKFIALKDDNFLKTTRSGNKDLAEVLQTGLGRRVLNRLWHVHQGEHGRFVMYHLGRRRINVLRKCCYRKKTLASGGRWCRPGYCAPRRSQSLNTRS